MAENDQKFIEYVVKALVGKPEAVKVERKVDEMGVLLELTVDAEDMGKVIGKEGQTAKALRTLLRLIGVKNKSRINLKIVEPEGSSRVEKTPEDEKSAKRGSADSEPAKEEKETKEEQATAVL